MSTDDRMETITDPAAIRATDEPDERGDFPCCTTPAPVGAAVALDLDAIEVRAKAVPSGWDRWADWEHYQILGLVTPTQIDGWAHPEKRADAIERTEAAVEHIVGMDPATTLALVAEMRRLTRWQFEALSVMVGLQDLGSALGMRLGESITGHAAAEAARALTDRAEAAEAEVVTLRARLAAAEALADQWADRKRSDGMSGNAWIGITLAGVAADLRAALATTGEGQ